MKHHDSFRPVGECKGCCLNLRKACMAGLQPKEAWRHRCKHYGDLGFLLRLSSQPAPSGAKLARLERKTRALQLAGTPHWNGVLDPGKMAGRSRRR